MSAGRPAVAGFHEQTTIWLRFQRIGVRGLDDIKHGRDDGGLRDTLLNDDGDDDGKCAVGRI